MQYKLIDTFQSLFEGTRYLHRNSSLGDWVASYLYEDLYLLGKSEKFKTRIDSRDLVLNVQNRREGIKARRGDGTLGEIIPGEVPLLADDFIVARGGIATLEIGAEVKILAKAMIKQIDRVISDLAKQVEHFKRGGGNPICVGIVGINSASAYTSYEGERAFQTNGRKYLHPSQEAQRAEARLFADAKQSFDEFIVLRFRASNVEPFEFEWVDYDALTRAYGASLVRICRAYDQRF